MSQILTYLKSQQDEMINYLEQWVNHDSPTHHKAAVDSMGLMTVQAFIDAGATLTTTHSQSELGNHYTMTYGNENSQILILAHFDTVWPLDETQRRPFTQKNGLGQGPGIHDMKGGTLIALFALKAIHQLQLKPKHKLVYLFNSDEEIGSLTSKTAIEAEGKKSSYCLVLEGSHNKSRLTTARKGVGRYNIHIRGRAAHAGVEPEKGISAIEELAHQIQKLHGMTDFARGVTVNVGLISGGERPNVVASEAVAKVDLRVVNRADGEALNRQILGLKPYLSGCTLTITGGINRWPFEETPTGLALFEKAQTIAQNLGFNVEKFNSGGGSDGNFVAALGIPTLDGLGTLGGGAHALTEYVVLESLPLRAAMLAELILQL